MIYLNFDALHHNLAKIKAISSSKILAIVKDNAYGHGLTAIVKEIGDKVDGFGVINLPEALKIRQYHNAKPIILMQGIHCEEDLKKCVENDLTFVFHHRMQLEMLHQNRFRKKLKLWVKVNCGLNRLGFKLNELESTLKEIRKIPNIEEENICIMSHLSSASTVKEITDQEIEQFEEYTKHLNCLRSLSSSAGILAFPKAHLDWIRPGLMLYGVSPFLNLEGNDLDLKPVMQFESNIISTYWCDSGEGIGYNKKWICQKRTQIAIVGIGYAHGYPYHMFENNKVYIRGNEASIIGSVSSDAIAIDITHIHNVKVGDKVVLWGKELPVERVALKARTVPDQLLCAVSQRRVD